MRAFYHAWQAFFVCSQTQNCKMGTAIIGVSQGTYIVAEWQQKLKNKRLLVREWEGWYRRVGGGHPSGAEDGLEVKAGAGGPIPARGEGLGQLADRARHRRRNQNLPRNHPRLRIKKENKKRILPDWPGTIQQAANQPCCARARRSPPGRGEGTPWPRRPGGAVCTREHEKARSFLGWKQTRRRAGAGGGEAGGEGRRRVRGGRVGPWPSGRRRGGRGRACLSARSLRKWLAVFLSRLLLFFCHV